MADHTSEPSETADESITPNPNPSPSPPEHEAPVLFRYDPRPFLVVVNPHSGRGKSESVFKNHLLPLLQEAGQEHEVFITRSSLRISELLKDLNREELLRYKSIILLSGDGLLYEVINAILCRPDWAETIKIPIALIPSGSGNGLAYSMLHQYVAEKLDAKRTLSTFCRRAIQDSTCQSDLVKISYQRNGKLTNLWSFLSIGWGLMADIDVDSNWLRKLGEFRFTIYGILRSIIASSYRGKLAYEIMTTGDEKYDAQILKRVANESNRSMKLFDDHGIDRDDVATRLRKDQSTKCVYIEDRFMCLYAVYQSNISRDTVFAPRANMTDQTIYLTYVRGKLSPPKGIEFLLAIEDGSHSELPYVITVPVKCFKFQPLDTSKVVVDGEVVPYDLTDGPMAAEIIPKLLTLRF